MTMDAKDLRIESALSDRNNDGSKYSQSGGIALHCDRNKLYQDIGSNSLVKVDAPSSRPCAVIGPDRVVPPPGPAPNEAYIKKPPTEPWPCMDNSYHMRRPPEYPHKLVSFQNPTRNISPRQTFQENMSRIMVPPSYNSVKSSDDNYAQMTDRNNALPKNIKLNMPPEAKFCDVPYTVYPTTNEQKNVRNPDMCLPGVNSTLSRNAPHGWPPSTVNIHPTRTYGGSELYQYQDHPSCAGPRPVVPRPNRTEESGYVYADPFYHPEANIRFKPYPTVKERYPHQRYEYIGNYANSFHPPPTFPSHKYDLHKSAAPHPYPPYPPIKYLDRGPPEATIEGYQRNQQGAYNMPFRNQIMHPGYGPVISNSTQNKIHSYPSDVHIKAVAPNKLPYDNAKAYGEFENSRPKIFPQSESYLVNEIGRMHPMKSQVIMPNYPALNIHNMASNPYYKKGNHPMKGYEYIHAHYRNTDPNLNIHNPMLRQQPVFSPNTLAISPTDSSASNDTQNLGTSQEDCGYVSQSSTASVRSMDSGINRIPNDYIRKYYDARYGPVRPMMSKTELTPNHNSKEKKNIDVRQFLSMWNEGEEESEENSCKDRSSGAKSENSHYKTHEAISQPNQEQLYVLGLVNVPSEELAKYEHIQKVSKLPENIKGYNHIELLNQFEEAIESSNMTNYKSSTPKDFIQVKGASPKQITGIIPHRPLSPLDVEAKISQSVIHKEVGCNFEIKPCSPKMLNVEVATPAQNILTERAIEKVANPIMLKSPRVNSLDDNIDCNVGNIQDHRLGISTDPRVSSCKMIKTPFSSNNSIDSIKNSYSLQDLESNSGLCLASLPRLDNDIELNFPEVNQQFINANKADAGVSTSLRDLPSLDALEQADSETKEQPNNVNPLNHENDIIKSPCMMDSEKEFSKLSKYRKTKLGPLDHKENLNAIRTDSVIIKNPDNVRNYEEKSTSSPNCSQNDIQQVPINLTSQGNLDNADIVENKLHEISTEKSVDIAIDFSLNKKSISNDKNVENVEHKNIQKTEETSGNKHSLFSDYGQNIQSPLKHDGNIEEILDSRMDSHEKNKTSSLDSSLSLQEILAENEYLSPVSNIKEENGEREVKKNPPPSLDFLMNIYKNDETESPSFNKANNNKDSDREDICDTIVTYNTVSNDDTANMSDNDSLQVGDSKATVATTLEDSMPNQNELANSTVDVSINLSNKEQVSDLGEKTSESFSRQNLDPNFDIRSPEHVSNDDCLDNVEQNQDTNFDVVSNSEIPNQHNRHVSAIIETIEPSSSTISVLIGSPDDNRSISTKQERKGSLSFLENISDNNVKRDEHQIDDLIDHQLQNSVIGQNREIATDLTRTLDTPTEHNEALDKEKYDIRVFRYLSYGSKEMYSPWIQKLILCREGNINENLCFVRDENVNEELSNNLMNNNKTVNSVHSMAHVAEYEEGNTNLRYPAAMDVPAETNDHILEEYNDEKVEDDVTGTDINSKINTFDKNDLCHEFVSINNTNRDVSPQLDAKNDSSNSSVESKPKKAKLSLLSPEYKDKAHSNFIGQTKYQGETHSNNNSVILGHAGLCDTASVSKDEKLNQMDVLDENIDEGGLPTNSFNNTYPRYYKQSTAIDELCEQLSDLSDSHDEMAELSDSQSDIKDTILEPPDEQFDCLNELPKENRQFIDQNKITEECDEIAYNKDGILEQLRTLDNNSKLTESRSGRSDYNDVKEQVNKTSYSLNEEPKQLNCTGAIHPLIPLGEIIDSKKVSEDDKNQHSDKELNQTNSDKSLSNCEDPVDKHSNQYLRQSDTNKSVLKQSHCQSPNDDEIILEPYADVNDERPSNDDYFKDKQNFCNKGNDDQCKEEITDHLAKYYDGNDNSPEQWDTESEAETPIDVQSGHNDFEKPQPVDEYSQCKEITIKTIQSSFSHEISEQRDEKSSEESNCIAKISVQMKNDCNNVNDKAIVENDDAKVQMLDDLQNRKHQPLKRSLSDSALNIFGNNHNSQQDSDENVQFLWPFKRRKMNNVDNDFQNLCNIIQNNRRNSISSFYNEENVSFCILIDNSCILTEEETDEEKVCYTQLAEECLAQVQTECTKDEDSAKTLELISTPQQEDGCEYSDSYIMQGEDEDAWVEDVACVETVISDDIAEDIEISGPSTPKDDALSDNDESGVFSSCEHTDKVKYIYGDNMCIDDAQFVDTLYNTPQMDVNKTLVQRENFHSGEYYDNISLEKILSEPNDLEMSPYGMKCMEPITSPHNLLLKETVDDKENMGLDMSPLQTKSSGLQFVDTDHINKYDHANYKLGQLFDETQDDTVHSCESSVDNDFVHQHNDENTNIIMPGSPEVSSTTPEEKNSAILLKITNYKGSRISQINEVNGDRKKTSCKFTEDRHFQSHSNFAAHRPLLTKAAQKYIPPLKESMRDLKVKLSLPQHSLMKLKQLKQSKDKPKVSKPSTSVPKISKKPKPKFEDVLKSIDEIQFQRHKEKSKKTKKSIPKVVIKKNENGSHYASTSSKNEFNPDLTGRKWQPWVFIEKNHFIDKMAIKKKTKAIYSHRKRTYVLAEKFQKYRSVNSAKFVISQPISDCPSTGLKYTIRLKHNY